MSCTDTLLNVKTAAQLFHPSDGTGFADLIIDGQRETWPLRSKRIHRRGRIPSWYCDAGNSNVRWLSPVPSLVSGSNAKIRRDSRHSSRSPPKLQSWTCPKGSPAIRFRSLFVTTVAKKAAAIAAPAVKNGLLLHRHSKSLAKTANAMLP